MNIYKNVEFHTSCSHYLREGIKQLLDTNRIIPSKKFNKYFIIELHQSTLRRLIEEAEQGLFCETRYDVLHLIIADEKLMPLANYFVLKNSYRVSAIRNSALKDLNDFFSGHKAGISGETLTNNEFRALRLSLSGKKHNMGGINPKTFYSQRYSALRKLGKNHYSMLYT